jgi:hypothetical protein
MYVDVSRVALIGFEHQYMHGGMNGGGAKLFRREFEVVIYRLIDNKFE